jgi:hypothetical protein
MQFKYAKEQDFSFIAIHAAAPEGTPRGGINTSIKGRTTSLPRRASEKL